MAKVTLKLDNRSKSERVDGTFPIIISVSQKGATRLINLKKYCTLEDWDDENKLVGSITNFKQINAKIKMQFSRAEMYLIENQIAVEDMDVNELKSRLMPEIFDTKKTTLAVKKKFLAKKLNPSSLTDYTEVKIKRLIRSKNTGNATAIETGLKALQRFTGNDEILFADVDLIFLRNFEAYCKSRGNKPNTISAYIRPFQTIFKEAIIDDTIPAELNYFPKYKIPVAGKTKKRALRIETIYKIREVEVKVKTALWDAKNYFLFMFNNMGINLIDVAKIEKHQIVGAKYKDGKLVSGRLTYERSKNKRQYSIKLTEESIAILNSYDVYSKAPEDRVFPIGYVDSPKGYRTYKQKRKRINDRIRLVAKKAGIMEDITSYYARHSWATIAKRKMLPISVIAEGLGHSDVRTTEIYLDSFDDDVLDDANDSIVS
ncbi:MAG: tyrosine-type recombinase/integrase [Crocinitomix sp.]|nr:tyrosine-type recombinase/integrase [Crocinitomix sp.]